MIDKILTCILFTITIYSCAEKETALPNIVLIMGDDIGYSDIGAYGGEIETPNINRLAEGGLRFTTFYNMAKCNPTRSTMLTGLWGRGRAYCQPDQSSRLSKYYEWKRAFRPLGAGIL